MAATANDTAAGPAPPPAAAAGQAPPPAIPEKCMHKNRLQEFSQRTHQKMPIYKVEMEGELHHPKFKCTVEVGGQLFSSTQSFSRRKEAEQDAARVAYETLVTREEVDVGEVLELIDQDVVFSKSILHEFAVKTKTTWPSYSVDSQEKPMTLFVASVVFNGNTYTGEAAISKKDAEQKAARAAIKSILGTGNTCLMEIIRSKKKLISAIRSSRNSKDTAAVSQETHNTPMKTPTTFTPIKFTRPLAFQAYGGPDHLAPESQDQSSSLVAVQGHILPSVDTSADLSAKSVTRSKKRKGRAGGSEVNEARIAKER